jgi:hypothetical protein
MRITEPAIALTIFIGGARGAALLTVWLIRYGSSVVGRARDAFSAIKNYPGQVRHCLR